MRGPEEPIKSNRYLIEAVTALTDKQIHKHIPSWWSSKLRCCRVSAEGFDRQAKEQGVTRPSMKLQDNHLSCLLLDNNSMNSCWILQRAERGGGELDSVHFTSTTTASLKKYFTLKMSICVSVTHLVLP